MQQSHFHPLVLVPCVRERKVKRKLPFPLAAACWEKATFPVHSGVSVVFSSTVGTGSRHSDTCCLLKNSWPR